MYISKAILFSTLCFMYHYQVNSGVSGYGCMNQSVRVTLFYVIQKARI